MRHVIVTILLVAYPGLLYGVYWCPSSGPRRVLELSVARDGSFTTSSRNSDTFNQGTVDYWAPDLTHRKVVEFSGFLYGWAHALSPDGDAVAAITTDGPATSIEVVGVADDTLQLAIDAPTNRLANRLYFCGSKKSTFLIADGDNAFVCSQDNRHNQKFQAEEALPMSAFGSHYFVISNILVGAPGPSGERTYDKEYRFYAAEVAPLTILYREKRSSDDWDGQGVAIGSDGTIAVQHPGRIELRYLDGSQHKIEWPMERGKLWRFDPTVSRMLLYEGRTIIVADAKTGEILASYTTDDQWIFWQGKFQDDSHLLLTERFTGVPRDSISGRIVKWNWRDDTLSIKSVGGSDAQTLSRRLKWLAFGILLWLLSATWIARTSRRRFPPAAVLTAAAVLCGIWAYHHPRFEDHYLGRELANFPSLVLTMAWLSVPVLTCFSVCKEPGTLVRRLPILVLVFALSADRLHRLAATGSWFFPLMLLLVLTWLVGGAIAIHYSKYRRARTSHGNGALTKNSSASFRLIDLLSLVAALAVALAVLSNFDGFDQDHSSISWALGCSVGLAFLAGVAGWASLSNSSWWKRFSLLVGFTFAIAWTFSQFQSIESGDRLWGFDGTLFATVVVIFTVIVAYATWLYRGTIVAPQADGSPNLGLK